MDRTTDAVGPRGKRADAQRNIAAILDAALECLVRNPDANIAEIARRAGVGRVTLYGHFSSREDLIDQLFARTLDRADRALEAVDLTGDPRAALSRLVASSWQIVDQFRHLLDAAQRSLPPARIRAAHEGPMRRIAGLIERGRAEGVFRTDLPATWMVALVHTVVHAAADEIAEGRLAEPDAARVIDATLQAAYAPPAG
ncbi:TetR/AcrR family transcriptional regulator [Micromonospora yasonensis]|uniref:TetR/AcrR family transcriptional regulator n=1 Tax=Micromonospora yasonensis TaxID=1128667 RepID=UPI00222E384D|nr:TetR/AcrR family transcriptional regulator [Micromonospora yasonensis]MCW3841028.1 TetR/AcrR family transcriptional regulator [Micromonospora yasonensis]